MLTATLIELLLAALVFTGGHFLLSSTRLRDILVARLGEKGFLGLFSLSALIAFGWLIVSYIRAPYLHLWTAPPWTRHLALTVMPFAFILLVGSLRPDNPTGIGSHLEAVQPKQLGIFAVTRHAFLWAVTLWATVHLLANGDVASLILFGSFLLLALPGTFAIDTKMRAAQPEGWRRLSAVTSNIPFAALLAGRSHLSLRGLWWPVIGGLLAYVALLHLHRWLFGVSPFPL
jgi:uncharacterized membrane protein